MNFSSSLNGAIKTSLRLALRYDTGKMFFGTMAMYDYYYFDNKNNSTFNFSNGKLRVFVGYRFNFKK